MSGPPPQPTALKAIRGFPGKRAQNRREPRAGPSTGAPPPGIRADPVALARWEDLAPKTLRMRTLDDASELVLELLCYALADIDRANLEKRKALTIDTPTNGTIVSPYVGIAKGAMAEVRPLLAELGFGPGSRSKIVIPPADEPKSKWAGLVRR